MQETEALAVLITTLKRRARRVDPIYQAECARFLVDLHGSCQKVAEIVGVSDSAIEIWVKLSSLAPEFQQYIRDKRIYPVAAYKIASAFPNTSEQLEMARALLDWPENEIVMVIHYKKANPDATIEECKGKVIAKGLKQLFRG